MSESGSLQTARRYVQEKAEFHSSWEELDEIPKSIVREFLNSRTSDDRSFSQIISDGVRIGRNLDDLSREHPEIGEYLEYINRHLSSPRLLVQKLC